MWDINNQPELAIQWTQENNSELDSIDDKKDNYDDFSFLFHYLDTLILNDQKRLLIDHYRIYLSTFDEFKPIFEQVKPTNSIFTSKS